MAGLLAESWARDAAKLNRRYGVDSTGVSWSINADGPGVRRALRRLSTNNGTGGYLSYAPKRYHNGAAWTPQAGLVVGMLLKVENLARITSGRVVEVFGASTQGLQGMFRFRINSDGTVSAGRYVFPDYTNQVTTAALLTNQVWTHLQFEVEIHGSTGLIGISQDGVDIATLTGQNTTPFRTGVSWTNLWSSIRLLPMTSDVSPFLDVRMMDLFVFDRSGSRNNTRVSEVYEVRRSFITLPGGYSEWTPDGAATNAEAVADMPEDDDTSTVAATTVGTRDEYIAEPVEPGVDPPYAQVTLIGKRTGPKAASVSPSFLGIDAAVPYGLSDDYTDLLVPYDVNPDTDNPLQSAELLTPTVGVVKSL
jgi:hypothetical protein